MKPTSLISKYTLHFSLGIALGATLLAPAGAASYQEGTGYAGADAGDMPSTAQIVSGAANTALTAINGMLTLTNGISEADMYQIYISAPTTFSATTNFFAQGVNNFDTQLFLFTIGGMGILANDDDGGFQSTLPSGSFMLDPGLYDLLITGSSRYPSSAGGAIFPNLDDALGSDPTGVYGPTGPGGGSAMTGYTGSSNSGGAYSIRLTGAQFVPAAVTTTVPEPSTIVIFVTGLALLFFARRRSASVPFLNASVSPL